MLGAQPDRDLATGGERDGRRHAAAAVELDACAVARAAGQEVHRRRADEARHEHRGRVLVHVHRRADLLGASGVHHQHALRERHRLDLVVRDVEARGAEAPMQLLDLEAHLHAQLGVEIRKRLVEQEHRGLAHDRPTHRDTLALAARELPRRAREQRRELQDAGGDFDALRDLLLGEAADAQAVRHVVEHAHVRIERVVLEHHRDVAVLRLQSVHHARPDGDLAARDLLQSRDHAQQRGLAATGRTDDDDELAVGDAHVDAVDHCDAAVLLLYLAEFYGGHRFISRRRPGPSRTSAASRARSPPAEGARASRWP